MKRLLAAALFCILSSASWAADDASALVEKWYAALASADRAAFAEILADDAVISLDDLDTEQTKAEFIASMDEWQDAMTGATIRHKIKQATPETISVLVCYTFPDNETLGRETFRVKNSKIIESVQSTIGDSCAEY